jgi:hypothetical protein
MSDGKQGNVRRTVLAGAGGVGALAAAAALLPQAVPTAALAPAAALPASSSAAGYRLTEHVKRYYETARV